MEKESLTSLVNAPEFRVVRARSVLEEGENLVEIVFESPRKLVAHARVSVVQGGKMVVDPERHWSLHSYEVKQETNHRVRHRTVKFAVVERGEVQGPLPVPRRAVYTWMDNEGQMQWDWQYDLRVADPPPPETDFRLPAFGISEPGFVGSVGKNPTAWYAWVACAGILPPAGLRFWLAEKAHVGSASGVMRRVHTFTRSTSGCVCLKLGEDRRCSENSSWEEYRSLQCSSLRSAAYSFCPCPRLNRRGQDLRSARHSPVLFIRLTVLGHSLGGLTVSIANTVMALLRRCLPAG